MKSRLLKYWDRLRSSFWFLPALMAVGAGALAFAMVALDQAVTDEWLQAQPWAYTGGAAGASAVLGTVAGSMITIAGVVFSMTLVALSLASSQFGPRLLRNFMRDTTNQVTLGTFVGTFLYCLLVLRTIRHAEEVAFVPHLSVTLGVVFALASLGVLIYFIHHVSVSIQADEIVARVGTELIEGIEHLFPELPEGGPSEGGLPEAFDREARAVGAAGDGYIQLIDMDGLLLTAEAEDALLVLTRRPGHYVVRGSPLVMAWPGARVSEELGARVNGAFILGNQRTPGQDLEFLINQLVEIAARALSPGVNDPFTASTCVDRLGSALCRLAGRDMPSPYRRDEQQRLRLVAPSVTFPSIVDAAFTQIRQDARASAAVTLRLLDTIAVIAGAVRRPEDRSSLQHHADLIARGARAGLPEEEDRRTVDARYQAACRALREAGEGR
jgi:uncharacterized membrane protein